VPAKYSLLSARTVPSAGSHVRELGVAPGDDALDPQTKTEIEDLVAEQALLFLRGQLGFTDFSSEERLKFAPVGQRLVRTNPARGRKSLFLSSHIGGIVGSPVPEVCDLIEHASDRQFVYRDMG
jgi:alpha-ketoglutarate-dependent 2,4-dichlorophenoxyacetate dioxygenase